MIINSCFQLIVANVLLKDKNNELNYIIGKKKYISIIHSELQRFNFYVLLFWFKKKNPNYKENDSTETVTFFSMRFIKLVCCFSLPLGASHIASVIL